MRGQISCIHTALTQREFFGRDVSCPLSEFFLSVVNKQTITSSLVASSRTGAADVGGTVALWGMGPHGVAVSPPGVGLAESRAPSTPQRTYTKYVKVCWKVATGQTTFLQEEMKERRSWEVALRSERVVSRDDVVDDEGAVGMPERPESSKPTSSLEKGMLLRSPMRALLGVARWKEDITPRRLEMEVDPPPEEIVAPSAPVSPPVWDRLLPVLDVARKVGTAVFSGVSVALVARSMARERSVGRVFLPVVSSKRLPRQMARIATVRAADRVAEEFAAREPTQDRVWADDSEYSASDLEYEDQLAY